MLRNEMLQTSFYASLYDNIPDSHILKLIDKAVDFGFVNELLRDSYCANFGRPAKEPVMMMKLLFLQYLYNLSDEKLMEESSYNLAYKWFLGVNPEDSLPDTSLLSKFRTLHLGEDTLDKVITNIVRQCVENGIIKSSSISIDSTHMEANCTKLVPERVMKHLARKIFRSLESDNGSLLDSMEKHIPNYTKIEDHLQAKAVMKSYLEKVIEQAQPFAKAKTNKAINEALEVLQSDNFIEQRGIRSLSDKDARVGNKSKTSQFFGYKSEFVMTTDERIITAATVNSGAYVDGKEFDNLLARTQETSLEINELYGDKAYFRKDILETLADKNIEAYIPVSASAYKIDEELFSYNKDSDEWFCEGGNKTASCRKFQAEKRGKIYNYLEYSFNRDICRNCKQREKCLGKSKTIGKKLRISINTPEFYEISQQQKNPEFLEKYKKRAAHEWKNGEIKRFYGMSRARGWGLSSVTTQVKLTVIAVNLRRIARIVQTKDGVYNILSRFLLSFSKTCELFLLFRKKTSCASF